MKQKRGAEIIVETLVAAGVKEFTLSQYDLIGNPTSASHASATNGVQTTWQTANYAYDGLNRMTSNTDRDNA